MSSTDEHRAETYELAKDDVRFARDQTKAATEVEIDDAVMGHAMICIQLARIANALESLDVTLKAGTYKQS